MSTESPPAIHEQAKLARLLEQHRLVSDFVLMLGQTTDLPLLYHAIYEYISHLMTANAFIVSSFDPTTRHIKARFLMADGVMHDVGGFPTISLEDEGSGIQSRVIRTGKTLHLSDFLEAMEQTKQIHCFSEEEGTPEPEEGDEAKERITTRSAILVPMRLKGEIAGVMQVQSKILNDYTQEDVDLLAALANVSAVAIQNAELMAGLVRANEQLRTTLDGALRAIAMTTEIRDSYTAGHQRRVADLACAIANQLRLDEHATQGLRAAALLHDIGKLSVPASILAKPGRLTDAEVALVREHPKVAYDILKTIESPWPLADIVLQHHERLDGSGYPLGVVGEAIRMEARILAVADVAEAMCSHRPYRASLGLDAALDELGKGSGELYDPDVVVACEAQFRDGGFRFSDPPLS
jgi:putative nucleotidyltransferase with HDIG domain